MDPIFGPSIMAGIPVRNRIFRSATDEGMADENWNHTDEFYRLYERLADNDVGCIFTTYMAVEIDMTPMKNMIHIDSDERIPYLKNLVDTVHAKDCPIICQITHAGTKSITGKVDISRLPVQSIENIRDNS